MFSQVTLEIGNIGLAFRAVVLFFLVGCKVGMDLVAKCTYVIGSNMLLGTYA